MLTCWVVAKQYSAVLRMLQMRQSSSKVNLATSEPSFSFSKLVMVSPPLLLVVLEKEIYKKDKTRKACGCADTHIAELPQGFNAIKSPDDHKVQCAVQRGSAPLYIKPQLLLLFYLLERQTELCVKSSGKGQLPHSQHGESGCEWNSFPQLPSPSPPVTQNPIKDYRKISVAIRHIVIFIFSVLNRCQHAFETLVTCFKN